MLWALWSIDACTVFWDPRTKRVVQKLPYWESVCKWLAKTQINPCYCSSNSSHMLKDLSNAATQTVFESGFCPRRSGVCTADCRIHSKQSKLCFRCTVASVLIYSVNDQSLFPQRSPCKIACAKMFAQHCLSSQELDTILCDLIVRSV